MKFIDYFNPHNSTHIEAFKHQEKTGWWPLWFADKADQVDRYNWVIIAMAKCSEAWVDHVDYKQKCKVEFIPVVTVPKAADIKKIADLVIKEINKINRARGIHDKR